VPNFSSINNDPDDSAIDALSAGEALHAATTSTTVAAIAAYQTDQSTSSSGAGVFAKCDGGGSALVGLQTHDQGGGSGVWSEGHGTGNAITALQMNQAAGGSGVYAESRGTGNGVYAKVNNFSGSGAAIFAEHIGNKTAGFFKGNVIVTGDVSFPGMDCAEEFVVTNDPGIEAGTLMAIGPGGILEPSTVAYDRKVVGVVAGAGDLKPGIVMGKNQHGDATCRAIALVGRAWCKADAAYGAIEIGDLLTSSATPGHAMRADDRDRSFGAVIGKAMAPLDAGIGLVPILIALQ
jgi:hypothetical protein